jgi:hypothetical protein
MIYLLDSVINQELYQLHRSPGIVRRLRWAVNVQKMGINENSLNNNGFHTRRMKDSGDT